MNDVAVSGNTQPTQSKSLLVRGGVVVFGVLVLAVAMPVIYYAFLSALGLLGLGITAVVGIGLMRALPFLGQKLENKLLSMRKAEARANPIEQIQNNVFLKAEKLQQFKRGLESIGGQIGALEDSLKAQAKKDPEDDLSEQWEAVKRMTIYYNAKKERYGEAVKALEAYKKAVERATFKYGFGTTAQGIAQSMNDADARSITENMLADEAFKSVDQRYNAAFAALDLDAVEINAAKQLTFGGGAVIDVTAIQIPVMQPLRVAR